MIEENIACVKNKIADAARRAGRNPDEITLVCVTKNIDAETAREAIGAGITDIGENRVQEALSKNRVLHKSLADARQCSVAGELPNIKWHMIGHLQTNKVKDAVRIFDLIHSLDSVRLAEAIDKAAKNLNKVQDVLIEVNASGEPSKFGVSPDETEKLLRDISRLDNIKARGLMAIAPIVDNPERARPYFRLLRELKDRVNNLQLLSMGMSQDYEVAIEEGSNIVRIGRAIFG